MAKKQLIESLHRLERTLLPALSSTYQQVQAFTKKTKLSSTEVRRALQWLEQKNLVETKKHTAELLQLGGNGQHYLKKGLPEKVVLVDIEKGTNTIQKLMIQKTLNPQEITASIGVLKQKQYIELEKGEITVTAKGRKALTEMWPEEIFLKEIADGKTYETLNDAEKKIFQLLKARKDIVALDKKTVIEAKVTAEGRKIDVKEIASLIDAVTPTMLRNKTWKGKTFRRFTLNTVTPKQFTGRKQSYRLFLDNVRKKFVGLGFQELTGPLVETEFWNMDSLFMPQFHSARDIHDAYYVKEPTHSKSLPSSIVQQVKKAHEKGLAGSKGWRYTFDVKRTHRHILRTHDTAISPRALASPQLKTPGKYFQMVRCFRYDDIDSTHLADFSQTGGFIIEEDVNLKHLFGLLKLFAEEFCQTESIKIVPAYFPFTEPSASLYAKHPEMGWIELGGSGIFRPEMLGALGVKQPVIAWGIGLERLAMVKLGTDDIRQLFSQDLSFLRNSKVMY